VRPGDVIVLLWRERSALPTARVLGAGTVATPRRPWGRRGWIDTVEASDPLYAAATGLGYRGPPNYMAMARIDGWTEDPRDVRRLALSRVPLLGPEEPMKGVPSGAFLFPLKASGLETLAEGREDALLTRIVFDPEVCSGKPVLRGLRVAVEHVLGWLAAGSTPKDIHREVPELEPDDVRACFLYAARTVANERILPRARV
jgi:uncharacterized protein (DUF433 family)